MRLICPKCDAQYEVDASAIPKEGRDVQCSSCGKTWFQKSATQLEAEGISADGETGITAESVPDQSQNLEIQHSKPDQTVQDILREEAARETQARHTETHGKPKSPEDIGLDQPFEDAPSKPDPTPEPQLEDANLSAGSDTVRRDMLPDIEELNSTLRAVASEESVDSSVAEQSVGRSGFRIGFGLVLSCATLALLGYSYAAEVIAKVPESEPFMTAYVEKVDGLRVWLDQVMQIATDKIAEYSNS